MDDRRVGFVGIGNMGRPMAANLAKAGFDVTVFDTNPARREALTGTTNIKAAATLSALAKTTSIVVTMLPNGHDVRTLMLEQEGGLAHALSAGALIIDMSSSDPVGTRQLGEALSATGHQFVDAPVSGGVPRAEEASLTIMIGSDDRAAAARARPVLSAMGRQLFETGRLGSGHAMKALNNFVAAAGFAAAAEAILAGERFGLQPETMVDIMNTSTGRNFSTENTIKPHVLQGRFASGFTLALLAKDVQIAAEFAESLALDLPLTTLVNRRWQEARTLMPEDTTDHTAAFTAWRSCLGTSDETKT